MLCVAELKLFQGRLQRYCVINKMPVSYYHSMRLLISINKAVQSNLMAYELLINWLLVPSTLTLMELLSHTDYDVNNLKDFNGFSTLDTVSISF